MTYGEAAEFPIIVLADHLKNIINGVSLTYSACKITDENAALLTRYPVDDTLTFTNLCKEFYQSTSYSEIDVRYKPYISQSNYDRYSEVLYLLGDTDREREAACVYGLKLPDPKTGFPSFNSLLCGQHGWTKRAKAVNDLHEINDTNHNFDDELKWQIDAIAGDSLRNKDLGYDELIPTNWTSKSPLSYSFNRRPNVLYSTINISASISLPMNITM